MRHLHFIEQNAIFELAGVPHHHAIAGDHVLAHVTATANLTILADPSGTFQNRTLFDNRATSDEDMITDERFSQQFAEHSGLQTKLQVTRNLFERVPDVILVLEQLRMSRVFEIKKIGRRKHFQCSTWRIAPRVASAFFRGARASRVLASASSRSRTFSSRTVQKPNLAKQKFVSARRRNQHAGRVCSSDHAAPREFWAVLGVAHFPAE